MAFLFKALTLLGMNTLHTCRFLQYNKGSYKPFVLVSSCPSDTNVSQKAASHAALAHPLPASTPPYPGMHHCTPLERGPFLY
eukprot:1159983-Pelagomonas_calceolata.AAC.1